MVSVLTFVDLELVSIVLSSSPMIEMTHSKLPRKLKLFRTISYSNEIETSRRTRKSMIQIGGSESGGNSPVVMRNQTTETLFSLSICVTEFQVDSQNDLILDSMSFGQLLFDFNISPEKLLAPSRKNMLSLQLQLE